MLGCPRRCLDSFSRKRSRAVRLYDYAVDPPCIGDPKNRAKVPRIFYPVKEKEERLLPLLLRDEEQVFNISILPRFNTGCNSLVSLGKSLLEKRFVNFLARYPSFPEDLINLGNFFPSGC